MYIPSLESGVADGIYDIIDGIVGDIYKQASMIKRLATHSGQDHYQVSCCTSLRPCRDVHGLGPSMGWVGLGPVVKFSKNVHIITVTDKVEAVELV